MYKSLKKGDNMFYRTVRRDDGSEENQSRTQNSAGCWRMDPWRRSVLCYGESTHSNLASESADVLVGCGQLKLALDIVTFHYAN